MHTWDVMRQDDLGNTFHVASHDSRIAALAQVLVMESGVPHKQSYWVEGRPVPPSAPTATSIWSSFTSGRRRGRRPGRCRRSCAPCGRSALR